MTEIRLYFNFSRPREENFRGLQLVLEAERRVAIVVVVVVLPVLEVVERVGTQLVAVVHRPQGPDLTLIFREPEVDEHVKQ